MRGYDLTISFTKDNTKYLVEIYEQPFHRWMIARAYHWYDMHLYKVSGFRKFDSWYTKRTFKGFPHLLISDKQNIKCAWLSRQDKEVKETFEVDKDTYVRLGGIA